MSSENEWPPRPVRRMVPVWYAVLMMFIFILYQMMTAPAKPPEYLFAPSQGEFVLFILLGVGILPAMVLDQMIRAAVQKIRS